MRAQANAWRWQRQKIALVATMGHLHSGHISLIEIAKKNAARTVVSIYINPLQFNDKDDFADYPRSLARDLEILENLKIDGVFKPADEALYPQGHGCAPLINIPRLSEQFCGQYRPGHFDGVCTVVAKLFNIISPHVAVFGKKDYQQLLIIQRLAAGLNFDLSIIGGETRREADGLALSSRNTHLSVEHRAIAPGLYEELKQAKHRFSGSGINAQEKTATERLQKRGLRVEYLHICDADNLQPPTDATKNIVILAAVWLGRTRLIDNILFTPA